MPAAQASDRPAPQGRQRQSRWGSGNRRIIRSARILGINLLVCSICLTLLFFETAFGICIGCKIYNLFNKEKAQLCPGGVCEIPAEQTMSTSFAQTAIVIAFAVAVGIIAQWVYSTSPKRAAEFETPVAVQPAAPMDPAEAERCKIPDYAKAIGHEEKWKLHNNCK